MQFTTRIQLLKFLDIKKRIKNIKNMFVYPIEIESFNKFVFVQILFHITHLVKNCNTIIFPFPVVKVYKTQHIIVVMMPNDISSCEYEYKITLCRTFHILRVGEL